MTEEIIYYGYVYKITCLINNRCYVGQHRKSTFDEKYWGSCKNKEYRSDLKKYGKENFKREILCWCITQEELNQKETEYIISENAIVSAGGYNLWLNRPQSEWNSIAKEKHNKNLRIAQAKPEYKEKLSKASKGKKLSEATKKKISISIKNSEKRKKTIASDEYRKNMSHSVKNSEKFNRWFKDPELKAQRFNDNFKEKISKIVSESNKGKHWWTKDNVNKFQKECPDEGWISGRSKTVKDKISKSHSKKENNK